MTATRTPTPVEKVPQSIQSLTRKLIEDQDLQNLTDALVNVSGVAPTSQAQAVLQPTLVRGFKVNYFIDGIPTYQLPEGAADPATLILSSALEVAKGPSATLYGGGAGAPLSGLINLVSRDPSTAGISGSAGLRAGSLNTWGSDADINLPLGDAAAIRISGMAESADSYVDFVKMDRLAIFPSLLVKLGEAMAGHARALQQAQADRICRTAGRAGQAQSVDRPQRLRRRPRCPTHYCGE
ncbi:MAG: TonB-dependent receptor plug domain-containing protein [Sphingomonadales bacterium]|nr:TonB-dependent receptor plug domain-containing protein [Sphingomonadales bacterium]